MSECRHKAASPTIAGLPDVAERRRGCRLFCRVPSHFHLPKSPSNIIRRYALNTLEVVWSVAEMSQQCHKVSPPDAAGGVAMALRNRQEEVMCKKR